MPTIDAAKILIMAASGFEQCELQVPLQELRKRGATVHVAAPDRAPIRAWKERQWGMAITPDKSFSEVNVEDYHALLLPSITNPNSLRLNPQALRLIRQFVAAEKVIAAICRSPWLLAEVPALRECEVISVKAINSDPLDAGEKWRDPQVVVERGVTAGSNTADLTLFMAKIVAAVQALSERQPIVTAEPKLRETITTTSDTRTVDARDRQQNLLQVTAHLELNASPLVHRLLILAGVAVSACSSWLRTFKESDRSPGPTFKKI